MAEAKLIMGPTETSAYVLKALELLKDEFGDFPTTCPKCGSHIIILINMNETPYGQRVTIRFSCHYEVTLFSPKFGCHKRDIHQPEGEHDG